MEDPAPQSVASQNASGSTTRNNKELENIRARQAEIDANSKKMAATVNDSVRRLREWARSIIELDQTMSRAHLVGMHRLEDEREAQKQTEQMAREEAAQHGKEVARMQDAYRTALGGVKDLRAKRNAAPEERDNLRQKLTVREERLHAHKTHAKKKISQSKSDLNAEFDNIKRLQTILGMRVSAVADRTLQFVYTQIDPRNPDKEFHVTVSMKNEHVETLDCQPLVHNYEELSLALGEGQLNLPAFLRQMRLAFVDACK